MLAVILWAWLKNRQWSARRASLFDLFSERSKILTNARERRLHGRMVDRTRTFASIRCFCSLVCTQLNMWSKLENRVNHSSTLSSTSAAHDTTRNSDTSHTGNGRLQLSHSDGSLYAVGGPRQYKSSCASAAGVTPRDALSAGFSLCVARDN